MPNDHFALMQRLARGFPPGLRSIHGPRHWFRVKRYGELLVPLTGADPEVVALFALFHDCQRVSESLDPDHGRRGGAVARQYVKSHFQLEPERLELLVLACEGHTDETTTDEPTIGTCWDSDRLDLDRVGINDLDPGLMSTEAGKELARLSWSKRHQRAGLPTFGNTPVPFPIGR